MARHQKLPELKLKEWKVDGKKYSIDPDALRTVILLNGRSEEEIRASLGSAYDELVSILNGGSIDIWSANIIEYGILKYARGESVPWSQK